GDSNGVRWSTAPTIRARRLRFSSAGAESASRRAGAAASSRNSQRSMPSSIRSAKSACSVRGRVPGSAWPNKAKPYSRAKTPASRMSEHHFQRKLDRARRARLAERAEVGVHLAPGRIESRSGKEIGKLRVIPGVEQLRPELNEAGLG